MTALSLRPLPTSRSPRDLPAVIAEVLDANMYLSTAAWFEKNEPFRRETSAAGEGRSMTSCYERAACASGRTGAAASRSSVTLNQDSLARRLASHRR